MVRSKSRRDKTRVCFRLQAIEKTSDVSRWCSGHQRLYNLHPYSIDILKPQISIQRSILNRRTPGGTSRTVHTPSWKFRVTNLRWFGRKLAFCAKRITEG